MSANTKIVVLRRKELLYTGIFAALGVLFVILLLMLLLPGKAADTSGAPDSPDSTAETVMPDNVADLGRIPQSAQTEDILPIPKHHGNVRFRTLTLKMAGQMFF